MNVCACECVCEECVFVCIYSEVHVCICMRVLVLTACIRVRRPVSLPLPQEELLICQRMLTNATKQLGALCAGKRSDHLASLTGFCENVTFHQAAIYRLLREKRLLARRSGRAERGDS